MGSKYFQSLFSTFICSLIICNSQLSYSQQSKLDSLKEAYQTASHDTTKINILLSWGEEIYLSHPDSALTLWEKAMKLAEKNLNDNLKGTMLSTDKLLRVFKNGLADACNNIGFIYNTQGEIENCLKYYFLSLKIQEEIGNKQGEATSYHNIGIIYRDQGEIEKALEYIFLSLKIFEELEAEHPDDIGNRRGKAYAQNNIGLIYREQGEIEKALEYYFLSLQLNKELKDKNGMADSYNNIGLAYEYKGETKKALEYYFLCLKIDQEVKNKNGMAYSYHNIGNLLCNQGSIDDGMKYLTLSLELRKELEYKSGISVTTKEIGGWQFQLGEIEAALESGLEALVVAKDIGHVDYIKRAAGLLGEVYKKQNKFEDALSMYELEIEMRDSIVNEETQKTTIRQQMKYEYEKEQILAEQVRKEELRIQNEKLNRRNNLHYSGIVIGLLVIGLLLSMLGFVNVSYRAAEGIIFIAFLIFFEFLLVLLDPYIEEWTGGAPGYKLLFNAILAGAIFPLHQFFEGKMKKRLVKAERKKWHKNIKPLMTALLVISHSHIFAQTDTLKKAVALNQAVGDEETPVSNDTTNIKALLDLAEEYYLSNPDTAIVFCEKALFIAEKAGLKEEMADCYSWLAYLIEDKGDIQDALEYNFKSVKILEKLLIEKLDEGTDLSLSTKQAGSTTKLKKDLAVTYNNIGMSHHNKGENEKALEYYFMSLKIREEIGDKKVMAVSYNNIGRIYNDQGKIEKTLEYNFLSLKLREEVGDKKGMTVSYNNIGIIYINQGEVEKALQYFSLALKIKEEIKDKKGIALSYNNFGMIYNNKGEVEKALEYFFLSLKIYEEMKDKQGIAGSYHNIGNGLCKLDRFDEGMRYLELGLKLEKELGYKAWITVSYSSIGSWQLKLGQLEVALKSGLEALALAKEIGIVDYIKKSAGLLSDVYKKQGKFEDALAMYGLELQMRDSISSEENQKQLVRQEMKYEYEKEQILAEQARKDQLRIINEQLSRRDNLHYSAIFIGILILFGGVLMLGFVKVKPKDIDGIIFISFLILFEFVLVLADPHIERYTGGA
ncbi:MAG: tetratricopeptide repeat protein, partial [Bacteroidia bacterium]|nr:tetratricopeptide repeat protein [Bacteroidia bacterium]